MSVGMREVELRACARYSVYLPESSAPGFEFRSHAA